MNDQQIEKEIVEKGKTLRELRLNISKASFLKSISLLLMTAFVLPIWALAIHGQRINLQTS